MWMPPFMELLAHPFRSLRTWIVVIAVSVVLLLALVNAPDVQAWLGDLIVILVACGIFVRVPWRIITKLILAALVGGAVVSLVREVMGGGWWPLIVVVLVLAVAGSAWLRVGALPALHRPPRARGARWASPHELKRAGFYKARGWPLGLSYGRLIRLPEDREREGVLVTAATGAGKSTIVVIPALIGETQLPAEDLRSVITLDLKEELTVATMPTLATTHTVFLWDPGRPDECTVGFDPLASLPGPGDEGFVGAVKQLAQTWFWCTRGGAQTTDPFWITQPKAILESLFLAFIIRNPKGTFVELADWTRTLTVDNFQAVLDATPHPVVRAAAETLRALGMSEKTIGPIWSDVLQRFDVLDDPRVRRSMAGPPVDVAAFVAKPTALYLRVSANEAQRLAPLLTMALNQMYGELTKIAACHKRNRLPRQVRVIVDEFGNLPRILNLEVALATLRSMGVGHLMLIQSSSQLTHAYGRDLAKTIQDNLVTKIILGGAGADDAKAFSARCGEITEYYPARTWGGNGLLQRASLSYAPDRHPLVTEAEIIHMQGEVLVSTRGIRPFRVIAQPYYANPATVDRLERDREDFAQRGPPPRWETDLAAPTTPGSTLPALQPAGSEFDRRKQYSAPPGCTDQEWDAAAPSLRISLWSMETELFALVTGRMDMAQIRDQWRLDAPLASPERYAKITAADRAKSPNVASYVDDLAVRLQLRAEDEV